MSASTAYRMKAQGAFDPKIGGTFDTKRFDEKNYWRDWIGEVKIPTPSPITVSAGYETANGLFINDESTFPSNGLLFASLEVSLLRGLIFDEGRHGIQEARLMGVKNNLDREILLRDLFFMSSQIYLNWSTKFWQLQVYRNFQTIFTRQHQNIIQLYLSGDVPRIDTVESRINLNNLNNSLVAAQEKYQKAKQELDVFLWDLNINPMEIILIPTEMEQPILYLEDRNILNAEIDNTPFVDKIENELDLIGLDRRLIKEDLKPTLNLKFNSLVNLGDEITPAAYQLSDYKMGANLIVPIRNRKTRAKLAFNKINNDSAELERTFKIQEIEQKVDNLIAQLDLRRDRLATNETTLDLSQALLDAENQKFNIGESSVFLLNKRQEQLIKAQLDNLSIQQEIADNLNELIYWTNGY